MNTATKPAAEREWLRIGEVVGEYPISPSLLDKLRVEGTGPRFFQHGRVVMYRRSDLEAWIESHMQTGGSAA